MSYPRMCEVYPKIIILDEYVEMTWVGPAIKYYQELGYEYPGFRDKFWCHVNDLPDTSHAKVLVQCPCCGAERVVPYRNVNRVGHSYCLGCAKIAELSGSKFGRLTVLFLDVDKTVSNRSGTSGAVYWVCECECGDIHSVKSSSLINGDTNSCGCYLHECAIKPKPHISGDKNPRWNPNLTAEDRIIGRNYLEYSLWRTAVYERDGYQCQACGSRKSNTLCAHHLYDYSTYIAYQTELWNGVTLCNNCHDDFHINFMGGTRKSCTEHDYYDWLEEIGADERLIELV